MSRHSMFLASAFIAATLLIFIIIALWHPAAAIFGACTALIGAVVAWLLLPRTALQDPDQDISLPDKAAES
ncbi:MAG: hypothetical protein LC731_08710, partial [Acidobacteria bacterium]|nr:hypothetical protein [Acidobacteriota bacterium]